jgi:hypothetical protein
MALAPVIYGGARMPDKEEKPTVETPEEHKYPKGTIGKKDKGHIVETAFGEGVDGRINDIADGDD